MRSDTAVAVCPWSARYEMARELLKVAVSVRVRGFGKVAVEQGRIQHLRAVVRGRIKR